MTMKRTPLASLCTLLATAAMACASRSANATGAHVPPPHVVTGDTAQQPVPPARANPKIERILEVMNHSSTWGHPDLFGQFAGMRRLFKGDYNGAMHYFKIGARYADKLSQLSIGMMYLNDRGIGKDPAAACAWITLAAERGYPSYVKTRDRVCQSLTPGQHDQAIAVLDALRPEYGDKIAKRRMKLELAIARNALTGSHLGHDSGVETVALNREHVDCDGYSLALGGVEIPRRGCGRYDPSLLDSKKYFAARDAQWFGTVSVGELQKVNAPLPSGAGKKQLDGGQ